MVLWLWIGFLTFIFFALALDLGVFHKKAHAVSMSEALSWTIFWIFLAILFNTVIFYAYEYAWFGIGVGPAPKLSGKEAVLQFFTGYLVEESLSLDNIFVIALIFGYFRVPLMYQHRVLFWGILGAIVMRGTMILAGISLIQKFEWITYVFGAVLLFTALKMFIWKQEELEPDKHITLRFAKRLFPVTSGFEGQKFFSRLNGKQAITPLFLVLIMVETMDLLFAIDSIPAIFAITRDPFLIFTSNVFAILGLRSMYFTLAAAIEKIRYLKTSLVFLLAFIGFKMLLSHIYPISIQVSLTVIVAILIIGTAVSIFVTRHEGKIVIFPLAQDFEKLAKITYKGARRIFILIIGLTVFLMGIAMIVLPGPAFLVIPIGLAILATEFVWARVLLKKVKDKTTSVLNNVRNKNRFEK